MCWISFGKLNCFFDSEQVFWAQTTSRFRSSAHHPRLSHQTEHFWQEIWRRLTFPIPHEDQISNSCPDGICQYNGRESICCWSNETLVVCIEVCTPSATSGADSQGHCFAALRLLCSRANKWGRRIERKVKRLPCPVRAVQILDRTV
jgi:hypothetical protein